MATLFPTLFSEGILKAELRESSKNQSLGPAFPPTAIQLYTSKFIHFASHSISPTRSSDDTSNHVPRPFEILSYQTAHITDLQNLQQDKKLDTQQPNLGVWNCFLADNNETNIVLASTVLNGVLLKDPRIPTFLLAIDLADPTTVYSTVTSMIQTILKFDQLRHESLQSTKHQDASKSPSTRYHPSLQTTSISSIHSTIFGQSSSNSSLTLDSNPQHHILQDHRHIRLILCAVLPPHASVIKQNYKEKQAHRLVHYHLQRYANELNCTLLFIQDNQIPQSSQLTSKDMAVAKLKEDNSVSSTSSSSKRTVVGLTVHELSLILRKLVDYREDDFIFESDDSNNIDATSHLESESEITSVYMSPPMKWLQQQGLIDNLELKETSLFLPDSHDTDLIESVLARNASCSGLWDAYQDPLWVALKPMVPTTMESSTSMTMPREKFFLGEQEWLNGLSDSLARIAYPSYTGDSRTALSDSSSITGTAESSKKINDEPQLEEDDVASFFDDLLK